MYHLIFVSPVVCPLLPVACPCRVVTPPSQSKGCEYFSIPLESGVCGGGILQLEYFSIHLEYFGIHLILHYSLGILQYSLGEHVSIHFENTSVFTLRILQYLPPSTLQYSVFTPLRSQCCCAHTKVSSAVIAEGTTTDRADVTRTCIAPATAVVDPATLVTSGHCPRHCFPWR